MPETTLKPKISKGSILVATWGWEQTNVDFYEVVRVTDHNAWIVPMNRSVERGEHWGHYSARPTTTKNVKPVRRKIHRYNGEESVEPASHSLAFIWSGHPVEGTDYA